MTENTTTAASGAASQPEALRLADLMLQVSCDQSLPLGIRQLAFVVAVELRRLHALTAAAPTAGPYSLDADPEGIRARAAGAITGALAFGAQGTNRPPEGHWLTAFWEAAQAEVAARAGAPAAQEAEPDFWTICAKHEGGGKSGWVPLPGYSNETRHGVAELVLQAARKEGYTGTATQRLAELGWEVRPVYLTLRPQADAGAVPEGRNGLPVGWVPLSITHEGQHPEEVAYGPQVMMDRLCKWLQKYFSLLAAAAPQAPAAPAQDMESVLIDGVAYQTPAPVAAELLRLHLEAMQAPAAGAAPEPQARTMHITELHGTYGWDGKVRGGWSRSYDAPMPAPDAPDAPRLIGVDMAAGPDATAYWTVNAAPTDAAEIAANVCRQVAELPDRNSPEDWPDAMLVTADELRVIVLEAIADASAPAQEEDDGWMPIETAPDGERVLLGPRHAPVVGTVHQPAHWHEEQEPTATVVHYNGTTLVAGYRCSEWHRLPNAGRARQEGFST